LRVGIYARLSEDRKGLSENVNAQLAEASDYAESLGDTIHDRYWDNDISASTYGNKRRPEYQRLMADIEANLLEGVVCTEVARLERDLPPALHLVALVEKTKFYMVKLTNGTSYNLRTGGGVHDFIEAVNRAMLESRTTSDRTRRRRENEAKAGKPHGGPNRPYGYEKGSMHLNEIEAQIIRECADRILAGETVLSVVKMLNERGTPTAKGKMWYNRNLEQILTARRIAGIRVHYGAEYPATWPAIISVEESDRLRLSLGDRRIPKGRTPKSYLLSGMVYCGICGKRMIASGVQREDGQLQRKYRCRGKDSSNNSHGCGKIVRTAEALEALVTEAVLYRCDSPEVATALRDAEEPAIGVLMDEYNTKKDRLKEVILEYGSGVLNKEQMYLAKTMAEEAIEQTRAKLARLENGRALASLPLDKTIREAWEEQGMAWRRSLVSLLVERVTVLSSWPGGMRWTSADGRQWAFDPSKVLITWRA